MPGASERMIKINFRFLKALYSLHIHIFLVDIKLLFQIKEMTKINFCFIEIAVSGPRHESHGKVRLLTSFEIIHQIKS